MKTTTLDSIAWLLGILRNHPALREVRPTAFHLNGHDFLHFHEEPDGVFADVRLTEGRVHMPVTTRAEQVELLERIEHCLSSLELHSHDLKHRGRQRRRH